MTAPRGLPAGFLWWRGPASLPTRSRSASTRTAASWWCTGWSPGKRSHDMVMPFVAAAIAMLIAMIPAGVVLYRGELAASVVAYEFITSVVVMVLALLAEA